MSRCAGVSTLSGFGYSPIVERGPNGGGNTLSLDRDPEFLVDLPDGVQILEIRSSLGDTGGT